MSQRGELAERRQQRESAIMIRADHGLLTLSAASSQGRWVGTALVLRSVWMHS